MARHLRSVVPTHKPWPWSVPKGEKKANTKWRTFSKIPQLASVLSVIQNKKAQEAVTANGREGGTDTDESVMSGTLYACWI